jgi:hypothetical protein
VRASVRDVLTVIVRLDRRTLETKIDVLNDDATPAEAALLLERAAERATRMAWNKLREPPRAAPAPTETA